MIKYKLICKKCNLTFDSWFGSSNEYEKLKNKKLLSCHSCNSLKVEKTIMAPKLINKKPPEQTSEEIYRSNKIKSTIKNFQKFIKKNFEYVGENFTYKARSIHYDKKKKVKGIYGTASNEDLKELKEEGIDAQMIPWIDDKSN